MNTSMNAPLLRPISLPFETYPFNLHATLSATTAFMIDFDTPALSFPALSFGELSSPATFPPTSRLRIVHPSLDGSILIAPSLTSTTVTVADVLAGIHRTLQLPLNTTSIPSIRRADILSYYQAYLRYNPTNRTLRRIHLLEGASFFGGLVMDVSESNRMLGVIDEMQALTWILITKENVNYFDTTGYAMTTVRSRRGGYPTGAGDCVDEEGVIPRYGSTSYSSAPHAGSSRW